MLRIKREGTCLEFNPQEQPMEENKYGLSEVESHNNYDLTLLNGFGKCKDASFNIFFQFTLKKGY
jgi:hypothetical protein